MLHQNSPPASHVQHTVLLKQECWKMHWDGKGERYLLCGSSLCRQLPDLACPCHGHQLLTSNQKYSFTHAVLVYKKHKNKFQVPCSTWDSLNWFPASVWVQSDSLGHQLYSLSAVLFPAISAAAHQGHCPAFRGSAGEYIFTSWQSFAILLLQWIPWSKWSFFMQAMVDCCPSAETLMFSATEQDFSF